MYFPLLRAKRFELQAVRELAPKLLEQDKVVPILEPVKKAGLGTTLDKLIDSTLRFAVIVNPKVGEFIESKRIVLKQEFIDEYLDEYDNYLPTLYVNSSTNVRAIVDFSEQYESQSMYILDGDAEIAVLKSIIASQPSFIVVNRPKVPQAVSEMLGQTGIELVELTNPFDRKMRNSDYEPREFFSDAHVRVKSDPLFNHFADYSIVGDAYTEGGGAAYTVALHHVVAVGEQFQKLDICHYKSDYSENSANVAGKFLEALTALINDQAGCSTVNQTKALLEYNKLYDESHFPGLGMAKKLGIMQHLEVVSNLLVNS